MTRVEATSDCDAYRELIPWYVNGTLSGPESELVREHIDVCAICKADAVLHEDMSRSVLQQDVAPMLPATSAADLIGGLSDARVAQKKYLSLSSSNRALAAGIAVIGVLLAALYYGTQVVPGPNRIFETATSPDENSRIDYVLQIRFDEGVSDERRKNIATQLDGAVKWNTNVTGDLEIHIQLADPSLLILQEYEQEVRSLDGVISAEFTAMQLPVR